MIVEVHYLAINEVSSRKIAVQIYSLERFIKSLKSAPVRIVLKFGNV